MRAITDTTDIHQAVAEARGTGATAIKLYAALSGELARRITTEAHAQGLMVWAHAALRPARPIEVVEAGVDAISHANLVALAMDSARRATALHAAADDSLDLDDAGLNTLLSTMVRRHTIFEPTLLVFADSPPVLRLAGAIAKTAHRRGVTIIAGTDDRSRPAAVEPPSRPGIPVMRTPQSVSNITAAGVRTSHTVTSLRTGSPMLRIALIALAAVAVVLLFSALPDIKRYLRIRRM